jgi:hypothetical protein
VRQAPSVFQGGIAVAGCQAGGNAGGSNTRGSAFLGFAFTPEECYAFMLAQAYQAVGQSRAACELINTTNAARRAQKRGFTPPSCQDPPVVVVGERVDPLPQTSPPYSTEQPLDPRYATKEELHRAFRRSVVK